MFKADKFILKNLGFAIAKDIMAKIDRIDTGRLKKSLEARLK